MSFSVILVATIGGLLIGIVVFNSCVQWGRAVFNAVRTHPEDSWGAQFRRIGAASLKSKGPWSLGAAAMAVFILPQEPWAQKLLAAGFSWIAFALVLVSTIVAGSMFCSANARRRARRGGQSDAA